MLFFHAKKPIVKTIFALFFIPITVFAASKAVELRSSASGELANIIIQTENTQGNLPTSLWQNYAQGGEEPRDMLAPVLDKVRSLSPKYIRIDHLFDYYTPEQLDGVVETIVKTGATPLLSLSYIPSHMSKSGKVAEEPKSWQDWYELVKKTVTRYSVEKNIPNIYYEVGNEPDLFGGWKYNKSPNYLDMYTHTARAVADGAGNSSYKIGGPATTALYPNWIRALLNHANKNNLRIDFISWHHYSKNPTDFEKKIEQANSILASYPQYQNLEKIITEIGPDSEFSASYDNSISAAHAVFTANLLAGKVHKIFNFEIIDGLARRSSSEGGTSSGWGLLTHPTKGAQEKPRYKAFSLLNQLEGQRLALFGNGSWVNALASKKGGKIQVILANYDPKNQHTETVPLLLQQLTPGSYQIQTTRLSGLKNTETKQSLGTTLSLEVPLEANEVVLLEIQKL